MRCRRHHKLFDAENVGVRDWVFDDPRGQGPGTVRQDRDDIEQRVKTLFDEFYPDEPSVDLIRGVVRPSNRKALVWTRLSVIFRGLERLWRLPGLDGGRDEVLTDVAIGVPIADELGTLVLWRDFDCFEAGTVEHRFKLHNCRRTGDAAS